MRKTKELLRLRFELGLGQRQIARSCGIGLGTVHQHLERAAAAGIGWPLPEGLGEEELEAKLFGNQPVAVRAVQQRPQPDWKAIHEQLQQHRHLTLQLLWEEYRQAIPRDIATVGFASAISIGDGTWMWCCVRNTRPGKRCLWTGRGRRFRSTMPPRARCGRPRCLFPSWEPVLTPTQRQLGINNWKPGGVRNDLPWTTINSDGWLARVGSGNTNLLSTYTRTNPVGALGAAALGATEIFKRIFRIKASRGPIQEFLSFSFFSYTQSDDPGPPLPKTLDLTGVLQVGAGAIGNGIDFLLPRVPSTGNWSIVDLQSFRKENLGTCILIGPKDLTHPKAPVLAEKVAPAKGFAMTVEQFITDVVGKEVPYPEIVINGLDNVDARRAVQTLWPAVAIDGAIGTFSCEVTIHPWGPDLSCLLCDFERPAEDAAARSSKLTGIGLDNLRNLTNLLTEEDILAAPEEKRPWLREHLGKQYCSVVSAAELAAVSDEENTNFEPSVPFVACLSSCMVVAELIRYASSWKPVLETGFQFDALVGPQNGIRKAHQRKEGCLCVQRRDVIEHIRRNRVR